MQLSGAAKDAEVSLYSKRAMLGSVIAAVTKLLRAIANSVVLLPHYFCQFKAFELTPYEASIFCGLRAVCRLQKNYLCLTGGRSPNA